MLCRTRPLDIWVPSTGSILLALIGLPVSMTVAISLNLPDWSQNLAMLTCLIGNGIVYLLATRVYARRHGTPFVTRAESATYRDAWAATQPLWQVILRAILPLWLGWTLLEVQYLGQHPLWALGPADWMSATAPSLLFGAGWTYLWLALRQRGRRAAA